MEKECDNFYKELYAINECWSDLNLFFPTAKYVQANFEFILGPDYRLQL